MKKNPFYRPDNGIKPTSIPRKPSAPQPPLTIGDDPNNRPYMPSRPRRGGGGRQKPVNPGGRQIQPVPIKKPRTSRY